MKKKKVKIQNEKKQSEGIYYEQHKKNTPNFSLN